MFCDDDADKAANNCDDCLVFMLVGAGGWVDYNGTGTNVRTERDNGHTLCSQAQQWAHVVLLCEHNP